MQQFLEQYSDLINAMAALLAIGVVLCAWLFIKLTDDDNAWALQNPAPDSSRRRYPVNAEANAQELHEFAAVRDTERGTSDNLRGVL